MLLLSHSCFQGYCAVVKKYWDLCSLGSWRHFCERVNMESVWTQSSNTFFNSLEQFWISNFLLLNLKGTIVHTLYDCCALTILPYFAAWPMHCRFVYNLKREQGQVPVFFFNSNGQVNVLSRKDRNSFCKNEKFLVKVWNVCMTMS